MEKDVIQSSVKGMANLFEDIADSIDKMPKAKDNVRYTILNYDKILGEMCDYLTGYKEYADKKDHRYDGKVLSISNTFYTNMFTDKKYRKEINLSQYPDESEAFLRRSNELRKIINDKKAKKEIPSEMKQLITMTENQYLKVSKVHKDDSNIYLWLVGQASTGKFLMKHQISDSTRDNYNNPATPVMHRKRKWVDD